MKHVTVDVWSDLACPWCYVGKRRLDKSINNYRSDVSFSVNWHAFIIDPATNPDGEEYLAYNRRRWGSDSWTHSLRAAGQRDGAMFSDWKWWPNTHRAHALVALAGESGLAGDAKVALFEAQYEEGRNISKTDVLQDVGAALRLEGVEAFLESEEALESVRREDAHAKEVMDIHGVPFFVVSAPGSKRYSLSGAQTPGNLSSLFDKVLRESADQSAH